jgi:hypothetical protein
MCRFRATYRRLAQCQTTDSLRSMSVRPANRVPADRRGSGAGRQGGAVVGEEDRGSPAQPTGRSKPQPLRGGE